MRVKAHGGLLDIEGILVATVNDQMRAEKLEVWMDPMALFDQVTKEGQEVVIEDTSEHSGGEDDHGEGEARCPITGQAGVAAH